MDNPLVTVSIIAYNSAKTIIETLDSIYSQSYPRIELIISDDCSSDNSIELCEQWLSSHNSRFERWNIVTSDKNTGVTANCNRAISHINGQYLKLLAADDLLFPEALTEYVNYMNSNPSAIYVFSKVEVFGDNCDVVKRFAETIFDYSFFSLSPKDQYKWLIGCWFQPIPVASCFLNVELAKSKDVLLYDERIPMLEDWPKWIVLSEKDIKFHFIDKQLAKYRVSNTSVCSGEQYRAVFRESKALLFLLYQFKPTIVLFGKRRAIALYIRNNAILKKRSIWSIMVYLMEGLFYIRDKVRNSFHHAIQ